MLWVYNGGFVVGIAAWVLAAGPSFFGSLEWPEWSKTLQVPAVFVFMGTVLIELAMMWFFYRCPACGRPVLKQDDRSWRWGPAFDATTCPKCGIRLV
jgi:predicted RNA-binding Zn-ribbon protein involved in translation (DUF1610 family)